MSVKDSFFKTGVSLLVHIVKEALPKLKNKVSIVNVTFYGKYSLCY